VSGRVELRGFEPLTSCMPSQLHPQTGHHAARRSSALPQLRALLTCRVVVVREVPCGRVADMVLTGRARMILVAGAPPQQTWNNSGTSL